MKRLLILVFVVIAAAFCLGFIGGPKYDISYVSVKVSSGLTLWEIADSWYMKSHAPMCFEAYLYELKHTRENEHLMANGRYLQPGDIVLVPMFKKK